jgi:hypothetical protein
MSEMAIFRQLILPATDGAAAIAQRGVVSISEKARESGR